MHNYIIFITRNNLISMSDAPFILIGLIFAFTVAVGLFLFLSSYLQNSKYPLTVRTLPFLQPEDISESGQEKFQSGEDDKPTFKDMVDDIKDVMFNPHVERDRQIEYHFYLINGKKAGKFPNGRLHYYAYGELYLPYGENELVFDFQILNSKTGYKPRPKSSRHFPTAAERYDTKMYKHRMKLTKAKQKRVISGDYSDCFVVKFDARANCHYDIKGLCDLESVQLLILDTEHEKIKTFKKYTAESLK